MQRESVILGFLGQRMSSRWNYVAQRSRSPCGGKGGHSRQTSADLNAAHRASLAINLMRKGNKNSRRAEWVSCKQVLTCRCSCVRTRVAFALSLLAEL
jgi:hypothetical protein